MNLLFMNSLESLETIDDVCTCFEVKTIAHERENFIEPHTITKQKLQLYNC